MAIQGFRTTGNFVADQRPKNWREGMLLRYPNGQFPLTALTSQMKTRSTDDPEFNWWEKSMQTRRVQVTTALTDSATTITMSGGGAKGFKLGDLLYVEQTGEIVRVTADPTIDTALTVSRGYANTTNLALAIATSGVNPMLVGIGSSYEEGSDAPTGVNFDPVKLYNYTQIFRNTLEATRTALKTRLRTGEQAKEAKRECLELHGVDMERAFWFGQRYEGTANGKPIRTTGGVISRIDPGNIFTADTSTGVDFAWLETTMEKIFRYGSSEKLAFCGNTALLTLQRIVRGAKGVSWTFSGDKEFGMNVTRITCPFGTIVFKTHPLFNQMPGGTNTTAYYGMDSSAVILDVENLKYVYLKDSDTKYESDLQGNGVDGMKSGYLTECGMEVSHGITHAMIKNLALAKDEA